MPGGRFAIPPGGVNRQLYSLRGVVERHQIVKSGFWIFQKTTALVLVRFREDQLHSFNVIAQTQMSGLEHPLEGVAPVIKVQVNERDLERYPLGADVGITLGYSGPVNQFFQGAEALSLVSFQVIGEGVRLENEVEVFK